MKISEAIVAEFNQESAGTRKMLERLPEDKLSYKPHPRSMSLGGLATHIAHIPQWSQTIVNDRELDLGTVDFHIEERKNRRDLLDYFEKNVADFQKTLSGKSDEHMFQSWTLKRDGKVMVELPRVACIRSFILSHIVHHRGQLTVYFRENEIPLPPLYGPTADEAM